MVSLLRVLYCFHAPSPLFLLRPWGQLRAPAFWTRSEDSLLAFVPYSSPQRCLTSIRSPQHTHNFCTLLTEIAFWLFFLLSGSTLFISLITPSEPRRGCKTLSVMLQEFVSVYEDPHGCRSGLRRFSYSPVSVELLKTLTEYQKIEQPITKLSTVTTYNKNRTCEVITSSYKISYGDVVYSYEDYS